MKRLVVSLFLLVCFGAAGAAGPVVELRTNQGTIKLELYEDKAPKTVENFLQYAKDGHYDGTIFHRVIDGFMIQGGGYDKAMNEKPTRAPIQNEARNGLRNEAGTVAMARTAAPHSASAQFFINLVDNRFLDYPSRDGWGYAVFGKVVDGFDVVQEIGRVPTGTANGMQNVPQQPVVIESVRVAEATADDKSKR